MNNRLFFFLLGWMLCIDGIVFLFPVGISFFVGTEGLFLPSFFAALVLSVGCIYYGRHHNKQCSVRESAWYMGVIWMVMTGLGMIPFFLTGQYSVGDAFFESASACTTTGIVLHPVYIQQIAVLGMWRGVLTWLGGLHFILLLATIMPQVSGCFGLFLSARQRIHFSPLFHQLDGRAKRLGFLYVCFTLLIISGYVLCHMPLQDALVQALLTVSMGGGYQTLGTYAHMPGVLGVTSIGMLLGAGNFLLFSKEMRYERLKDMFCDIEWRVFMGLILCGGLGIAVVLYRICSYSMIEAIEYGLFHTLSFLSTSGYVLTDVAKWPDMAVFILFISAFIGGGMGSVTGGLRIIRCIILIKVAIQEMKRTLHPRMVLHISVNKMPVEMQIMSRILTYFFLFVAVFFVSALVISLGGISPLTAMGLSIGALSSTGTTVYLFSHGDIVFLPMWVKVYSALLMIIGRIEIFSFFIMVHTGIQYLRRQW